MWFALDDQRAFHIVAGLCSVVFDAVLPSRAQMVKAEAVVLGIEDGKKAVAAGRPLGRVDLELEHGKLHALAVIETCAG